MHRFYKLPVVCLLTLVFLMLHSVTALAGSAPYHTRIYDSAIGYMRITKDGYLPLTTIEKFGEKALNNASDIMYGSDGFLYIADTANGRVVKMTVSGEFEGEIGADVLGQPRGLFVSPDGNLYVADFRHKAVFLFDSKGNLIHTYTQPTNELYGAANFSPSKVAADQAGNVYIISDGNVNGIIQLSKEGDFFGYVGANNTPLGISAIIQRFFFSEEQKAQLKMNVPATANNLAIDSRGLIYTTTQGGAYDGLKKLNIAGKNMLDDLYVDALVTDVCVGSIGNIFTVSTTGFITEYTMDGDFLFLFGGKDDGNNRDGLFVAATGVTIDPKGHLYVLDGEKGKVTVFQTTEYADTIHHALDLHQRGLYGENRDLWESALRQDAMFTRAYRGLGDSYYKLEMYDEALEAYRSGYSGRGYSDSFWEIRNVWLMKWLPLIFSGLIVLAVCMKLVRMADRRWLILEPLRGAKSQLGNVLLLRQIGFMKTLPRNPADAFYGIRFERKVSITSSTIIYILFFLAYLLDKYFIGFLFKTVGEGYYELLTDAATVFGFIFLVVVSNNLVCAISDGEARLRDVYCGFAYCLMPFIYGKPVLVLVSHALTYNEQFIITMGNFIIYAGIGILTFVMVKDMQDYSFGKTIRCVILTIFVIAMIVITSIILLALVNQVLDFIMAIVREVSYRATS